MSPDVARHQVLGIIQQGSVMTTGLLQMEDDMEEWDLKRSLFDNHMADSMQSNLEYMWKKFGFYFPEADLLLDPEGLLRYLVSSCICRGVTSIPPSYFGSRHFG